jgi:hypothetical protein
MVLARKNASSVPLDNLRHVVDLRRIGLNAGAAAVPD